jgi:hypothetical protein
MPSLEELVKLIPVDQVASKLGVDTDTAKESLQQALPALVAGLSKGAQTPEGAQKLQAALTQHDPNLVEGGVDVDQVDVQDGEKILGHAFGGQKEQVVAKLAEQPGSGGSDLFKKLLPMAAPIVLSYLSKQLGNQQQAQPQAAPAPVPAPAPAQPSGGLDIGGLLGGLLGGGGSSGGGGGGGLDIGGLIGGLLGGNR